MRRCGDGALALSLSVARPRRAGVRQPPTLSRVLPWVWIDSRACTAAGVYAYEPMART